jgi:hypothetical protein
MDATPPSPKALELSRGKVVMSSTVRLQAFRWLTHGLIPLVILLIGALA